MKIIVSGGGTGGHIYPAISIIEEFLQKDPTNEILYVGTENGLEKNLVSKEGYKFRSIHVKGIPRKLNKKSIESLIELNKGLQDSKKIIQEFKPDIVIGTGGFVSGPIVYQASRKKDIITAFHEQNSYPGITNRILSRFTDIYFVTFKDSLKRFKNTDRAIISGNPIRNRFVNIKSIKNDSYKFFDLSQDSKTIFTFGGSNGSKCINECMKKIIRKELENKSFQIIHAAGKNYFEEMRNEFPNINNSENIRIYEYMTDVEKAYAVSDLIITSSGAITLAELSYTGKPSILIPKAYTTENHQEHNARNYERANASEVILESELNENLLYEKVKLLIKDDQRLAQMGENAKNMGNKNASEIIVDMLYEKTKQKKKK